MQPSHELQNVDEVLTLVSKHPHGVMAGQIKDAYKGVGEDVKVCFVHLTYCGLLQSSNHLLVGNMPPPGIRCAQPCVVAVCMRSCSELVNNDLS